MSFPNMFNKNLVETPINFAYNFQTTKDNNNFMQNALSTPFSSICIFCSCKDTIPLMKDGSFRFCKNCKKQFKSKIT